MKKSPMDFAIGDRCCFEVLCAMYPHLAPDSRCQLFRLAGVLWAIDYRKSIALNNKTLNRVPRKIILRRVIVIRFFLLITCITK